MSVNPIRLTITVPHLHIRMSMRGAPGPQGEQGEPGPQGIPGAGFPVGGTAGQIIVKQSSTDYDTAWEDQPADLAIVYAIAL